MLRYDYKSVMEYYMDYQNDTITRKVIVTPLCEAEENKVLLSLVNKLYDNITKRVDDIDMGGIPATRGDITKLPEYDKLLENIHLIKEILDEYNQDTKKNIDIVIDALDNITKRTRQWELAFKGDIEFLQMLYSTVCLGIVASTSYLIHGIIDFVKDSGATDYDLIIDTIGTTKTSAALLLDSLTKFNVSCKKGDIDKVMDQFIKAGSENMLGMSLAASYGLLGGTMLAIIALSIIPMMREIIYFQYYARVKFSDYCDLQAELLSNNVNDIRNGNSKVPGSKKAKVIKKQEASVARFRKMSNFIGVKMKDAENKARKEIVNDTRKIKYNDISNELPDSVAANSSSLF